MPVFWGQFKQFCLRGGLSFFGYTLLVFSEWLCVFVCLNDSGSFFEAVLIGSYMCLVLDIHWFIYLSELRGGVWTI